MWKLSLVNLFIFYLQECERSICGRISNMANKVLILLRKCILAPFIFAINPHSNHIWAFSNNCILWLETGKKTVCCVRLKAKDLNFITVVILSERNEAYPYSFDSKYFYPLIRDEKNVILWIAELICMLEIAFDWGNLHWNHKQWQYINIINNPILHQI